MSLEKVLDTTGVPVRISFDGDLTRDISIEEKTHNYQMVTEDTNLMLVLSRARELDYFPDLFRQSVNNGSNGHLRLKNKSGESYARITSTDLQSTIRYTLYIPVIKKQ